MSPAKISATLFSATQNRQPEQRIAEWDRIVRGNLRVLPIPGNHFSMMLEPNLQHLAENLDQELDWLDSTFGQSLDRAA